MKRLFKLSSLLVSALIATAMTVSCTTDDVAPVDTPETPETPDVPANPYVAINDQAFAEYLQYGSKLTSGSNTLPTDLVVERDGQLMLDTLKAATVTNLYIVKTTDQITELTNAGVATAEQKIVSLEELRYFKNVNKLRLTSNAVTAIDLSALTKLDTLEMNNNLVANLDLSHNTRLKRLRYGASSAATDGQKLTRVSFANNNAIEHIYLKGHAIAASGIELPTDYSHLTEIDLSGNPGANFPLPKALYGQLKTKKGVKSE